MLATPVFHRWHHTTLEEGGNTNFAGTFPLWDILFGTFRMPENKMPKEYGKDEADARRRSAGRSFFRSVGSDIRRILRTFAAICGSFVNGASICVGPPGSAAYRLAAKGAEE